MRVLLAAVALAPGISGAANAAAGKFVTRVNGMRILLAVLSALASIGAARAAADCSKLRLTNTLKTGPLGDTGLVTVPITLNGVEEKFLFDTGGALDQISEAAVRALNLREGRASYSASDLYGHESDAYVRVSDVALGWQHGSTEFMVMPTPQAPFDGIISTGRFNRQDVDLDFGARRVNFFSPDHCEGSVVYWPHQILSVVPIAMEHGHIVLPVKLDGQSFRAILDTGSTHTVLNIDRAEETLGFSPDAPAPAGMPPGDPARRIFPRRFGSLSFEGVSVNNPMVTIRPLTFARPLEVGAGRRDDDFEARGPGEAAPDMIVGMDVLSHLHVYVAINEQKLYVTEAGSGESVLFKNGKAMPAPN